LPRATATDDTPAACAELFGVAGSEMGPLFGKSQRVTGAVMLALLCSPSAMGVATTCDPDLRPPLDTPYAYRQRGDVCEGLYARDVGGRPLVVVALTSSVEEFIAADGSDLVLNWTPVADQPTYIRADALRPNLYYRMDAVVAAPGRELRWSPTLLKALDLTRGEIGIVAWTLHSVGTQMRAVLTPVRLRQKQADEVSAAWHLVVLPAVEMDEVYFTVTPVDAPGVEQPLVEDHALGRSYYPADRPVQIELPSLPGSGIYRVDVAARVRAGGSATDTVWIRGNGS
jgi:hypothetical protein